MIQKLQIRNFRTHEKLDIDFNPLVNSIIGRNAAGKSTIIRAIRWVVRNKPAGDSVINWGADKAAVRLTIDGNKITRTRGKGINTYKFNKSKPYKAFRNEVPKDIERIINLSDINFQGQHEAPFWFCKTAGEVSRQLNAIVNLDVIDKTLSNIDSALHESQTTIKITKKRLGEIIQQQDSLAYVEEMDKNLKRVEYAQNQYQKKATELARLQDILELVQKYRNKQKNKRELVSRSHLVLDKGQRYQELVIQVENLSKIVKLGESLLAIASKKPPSLNCLTVLKRKRETIISQYTVLKELVNRLERYEGIKCRTKEDLKKHKIELDKSIGKYCPLCGQSVNKKLKSI